MANKTQVAAQKPQDKHGPERKSSYCKYRSVPLIRPLRKYASPQSTPPFTKLHRAVHRIALCCSASNCMGCPNFGCEFVRSLAIAHLYLQLCFTIPVTSTRFCYFAHMILLHHRIFCHFVHEYPCFSLRLPSFKLPLFGLCMVT